MDNLSQLTEQDYEKMAIDIEAISQKDENEIFQMIGNSLESQLDDRPIYLTIGMSLESPKQSVIEYAGGDFRKHEDHFITQSEEFNFIQPKMMFDNSSHTLSTNKAYKYVNKTVRNDPESAAEKGKSFWEKFKDKLKEIICNDEKTKALLGKETLKVYLITGIPIVLTALGMVSLNPGMLVIISSIFALILKVGIQTYCEM